MSRRDPVPSRFLFFEEPLRPSPASSSSDSLWLCVADKLPPPRSLRLDAVRGCSDSRGYSFIIADMHRRKDEEEGCTGELLPRGGMSFDRDVPRIRLSSGSYQ